MIDLIIASIVASATAGIHSLFSSGSSDYERRRKYEANKIDIDPVTGDYTNKVDGSRWTKDDDLIHW